MAADKEGEGAAARGGRSVDEKRGCGLGLGATILYLWACYGTALS